MVDGGSERRVISTLFADVERHCPLGDERRNQVRVHFLFPLTNFLYDLLVFIFKLDTLITWHLLATSLML